MFAIPFDQEVMDIKKVKREFGKDLTLMGGLGSQSTFPLRNPEAVKKEIAETLSFMNEGGGYILRSGGCAASRNSGSEHCRLGRSLQGLGGGVPLSNFGQRATNVGSQLTRAWNQFLNIKE